MCSRCWSTRSRAGASQGDDAARLLIDLLEPYGVAAVALYRAAPDDSLRLVGQHGYAGDVMSSWRSIPPSRDIPYVASVIDDKPFLWGSREDRLADFPNLRTERRSDYEAAATIPFSDAGSVVGVAGLAWQGREVFDEGRSAGIVSVVQRVAPLLLRNAVQADPELDWLNTLLKLHLDPWLLFDTVRGADGSIRDFVVLDHAATVPDAPAWVGRRMLELWPSLAGEGVSTALAGLAGSGGSWTMTVATSSEAPWGTPGSRVRAVRLGRRIALVWRPGRAAERRSGSRGEAEHQERGLPTA